MRLGYCKIDIDSRVIHKHGAELVSGWSRVNHNGNTARECMMPSKVSHATKERHPPDRGITRSDDGPRVSSVQVHAWILLFAEAPAWLTNMSLKSSNHSPNGREQLAMPSITWHASMDANAIRNSRYAVSEAVRGNAAFRHATKNLDYEECKFAWPSGTRWSCCTALVNRLTYEDHAHFSIVPLP
jgi:hypothetical protein